MVNRPPNRPPSDTLNLPPNHSLPITPSRSLPADQSPTPSTAQSTAQSTAPTWHRLGFWQHTQRQQYRKGQLSAARVRRLEKAGFSWDPSEANWELGFRRFISFAANEEGFREVPRTFVDETGFKLGVWQSNQRQRYKHGTLNITRIKRLENAGIIWDPNMILWEAALARFLELQLNEQGYRELPHGERYASDGFNLYSWITVQRQQYKAGELSIDKIVRLEEAGFIWSKRRGPRGAGVPQKGSAQDKKAQRVADGKKSCDGPPPKRLLQAVADDGRVQAALDADSWHRDAPVQAWLDEASWHREWRRRLGCWWLAMPDLSRTELGGCLAALSLHLGARLERLIGAAGGLPATGRLPASGARSPSAGGLAGGGQWGEAAAPGCEWVGEGTRALELPHFPSVDGVSFTLPPIPRLVPSSIDRRGESLTHHLFDHVSQPTLATAHLPRPVFPHMHDASFIPPNSTPFLPPNSTSRLRRSPEQAWRGRMAAANGGGFRSEHFRRLWSSWSLVVVPAALSYRRCPARRRARRPPKLRSPKLRSPKFKCLPRTRDGLSARSTATGSHSSVVNSHAKFRCSR